MMKTRKKCMACFCMMLLLMTIVHSLTMVNVEAKSKTMYYHTNLTGNKSGVKRMKLSGNKLIIWGKIAKKPSSKKACSAYYSGKGMKYKKTTLVLSKTVKIFGIGGDGPAERYSKAEFKKYFVKQPGIGLDLSLKQKNGKIVRIELWS